MLNCRYPPIHTLKSYLQYLRVGLYLESGLLPLSLVKMRSYQRRVGPNPMWPTPLQSGEVGPRNTGKAELCCHEPRLCQKLRERPGADASPVSAEGAWPRGHPDLNLWAPEP